MGMWSRPSRNAMTLESDVVVRVEQSAHELSISPNDIKIDEYDEFDEMDDVLSNEALLGVSQTSAPTQPDSSKAFTTVAPTPVRPFKSHSQLHTLKPLKALHASNDVSTVETPMLFLIS